MTGPNVADLVRWGGTDPNDILRQAAVKTRDERLSGAEVSVVVARVTRTADGRKFYDVFYSEIEPDSMLWLAKLIEMEALDQGDGNE